MHKKRQRPTAAPQASLPQGGARPVGMQQMGPEVYAQIRQAMLELAQVR